MGCLLTAHLPSTCEAGGIVNSVEMLWNNPMYSGAEKFPERCFGNPDVKRSAFRIEEKKKHITNQYKPIFIHFI